MFGSTSVGRSTSLYAFSASGRRFLYVQPMQNFQISDKISDFTSSRCPWGRGEGLDPPLTRG